LLLPLHSLPSGMKPTVPPLVAPARLPTANQLYSELVPLWATAAWQAGFCGTTWPVEVKPSW